MSASANPVGQFGDGFLLATAICPITSPEREAVGRRVSYRLHAELGYSWGRLHPIYWSEALLLLVLLPPKFILLLWFLHRCRMFRDHVMAQQRWFLITTAFSLISSLAYLIYLLSANVSGEEVGCCPTPLATSVLIGFKYASNMCFDLLLLATCKGWGVVDNVLASEDRRKIIAFFLLSMAAFALSHSVGFSLALAWLFAFTESVLWVWIFLSLRRTIQSLIRSNRIDRHAKLEMYASLHRLLLSALVIWLAIGTLLIFLALYMFSQFNRLDVANLIPGTLAWELTLLYLMIGFGYVWRPSPATAAFSYGFARRENDESAIDPVEQFGLESM